MNEEMRREALNKILEGFAEQMASVAKDAIGDCYSDILPYVLDDTDSNAMIQSACIVESLMAGQFDHDGEYITVRHPHREFRVQMKFTEFKYDALRDRIIERMATCPKDAKIAELEDRLRRAENPTRF